MIQGPRAGWRRAAWSFGAGGVAALGLAPFDLWMLGLLGFAIGLACVAGADRPARMAWVFGLGYFALSLHWIVEPFFVDAARHGWMAPFALILMAGGMALFWMAAGWLASAVSGGLGPQWRAVLLALALTLAEGARAYVLSGFPWAHPGHGLIDTPLLATAAWVGPHGLTLIMLGAAAGLAALTPLRATVAYAALVGTVSLWPGPDAAVVAEDAPRVRLIQPNAPQHLKWDPEMIPIFYERALALTRDADVALVVWPETALPVLLEDSAMLRAEIAEAAGVPVIFGVQRFPERRARNTLALIAPDGAITDIYDKHRLVPFGEYMPVRRLAAWAGIDGLAAVANGGYHPGTGPATLDLGGPLGRAFVMICYEAIFPQYLRQVARPDWQLHITNDAWFGSFSGPYQHLALARLRAAEAGLPVLRAANTGVSAVIDGHGRVLDQLPLNVAGALDVALPPPLPPRLYARLGDGPVLGLVFLVFAGLSWRFRQFGR